MATGSLQPANGMQGIPIFTGDYVNKKYGQNDPRGAVNKARATVEDAKAYQEWYNRNHNTKIDIYTAKVKLRKGDNQYTKYLKQQKADATARRKEAIAEKNRIDGRNEKRRIAAGKRKTGLRKEYADSRKAWLKAYRENSDDPSLFPDNLQDIPGDKETAVDLSKARAHFVKRMTQPNANYHKHQIEKMMEADPELNSLMSGISEPASGTAQPSFQDEKLPGEERFETPKGREMKRVPAGKMNGETVYEMYSKGANGWTNHGISKGKSKTGFIPGNSMGKRSGPPDTYLADMAEYQQNVDAVRGSWIPGDEKAGTMGQWSGRGSATEDAIGRYRAGMARRWGDDWENKKWGTRGGIDPEGTFEEPTEAPQIWGAGDEIPEPPITRTEQYNSAPTVTPKSTVEQMQQLDTFQPPPRSMMPTPRFPTERVDAPGEMQLGYEQEDQVPLSPGYQANKPTSSWIPDWLKEDIDTHRRDSVNTSRKRQDLEQEEIDQGFPSGPTTGGVMEKERFFGRPVRPEIQAMVDEPAVRGLSNTGPNYTREDIYGYLPNMNTAEPTQAMMPEEIRQEPGSVPVDMEGFFSGKSMLPSAQDQRPVTDEPAIQGLASRGNAWDDAASATGMNKEEMMWEFISQGMSYENAANEVDRMTQGGFGTSFKAPSGDYMGY